ncbi:hypothetical protein ARMSODRAFT_839020, partial [Armillaria solidipes]
QASHIKMLTQVQNRALHLICAAFRTTPIVALEIEVSIPPMRHLLDLERDRFAVQICKFSETSPIIQRLADEDWRSGVTGASWVAMIQGKVVASQSIGTGPYAEVYDSELIGLAWATQNIQRLRTAHPSVRHIHFFADNSSAVDSIIRPKRGP